MQKENEASLHKIQELMKEDYLQTFLQFLGLVYIVLEIRFLVTGKVLSPARAIQNLIPDDIKNTVATELNKAAAKLNSLFWNRDFRRQNLSLYFLPLNEEKHNYCSFLNLEGQL